MKKAIKKIIFPVFLIMILAMTMTMTMASAADDYTIEITANSLGVGVEQNAQLTAEVEGLKLQPKILWSSSDESVATVNAHGVVTGIDEGEALITATAVVDGETVSTAK